MPKKQYYTGTGPYGGGRRVFIQRSLKQTRARKKQQKRTRKEYERGRSGDIYADTGRLFGVNPVQLLFRTRVAAVKYARSHGAKKFSVRKLKRGRA
jgi:hypothetical protein